MFLRYLSVLVLLISSLMYSAEINKNGYLLFLLGEKDQPLTKGWTNHADATELLNWGNSKNIDLVDDMAPVANQKASFIPAAGVTFSVAGMKPHLSYFLWVDFVKFKFKKNPGIYSELHIFVDDRQVDIIKWGELPLDGLYKLLLPLDLTYDGDATISFKEYSNNYGYWGVWDLIVSTGDLPKGSYFASENQMKKDIGEPESKSVEKDSTMKKTIPDNSVKEAKKKKVQTKKSVKKKTSVKKKKTVKSVKKPKKSKKTSKKAAVTTPVAPKEPDIAEPSIDQPKIPEEPTVQ